MKLSVCVAAVAGLALCLTACGPAPSAAPAPTTSQRHGFPQRRPGVSGTVAALSGNTMQVQNTQGQTAVTFGPATHFTDTAAASLAGVTTGECVLATGPSGSGGVITATSVSIMDSCTSRPRQGAATRRQFAAGTVKSLSSKGFTLTKTTGGTVTVTVGAHTTYAKTAPATAAALAVGECVMASGKADSTGTVTATTVAIRPAGCSGKGATNG